MQRALVALYGPYAPMTADELAAFNSAKAKVAAADARKRQPSPQLELPE